MKENKAHDIGMLGLAAPFVGGLVGAGFASGQEIMQFFGAFGNKGYLGICLMAVVYIVIGIICCLCSRRLQQPYYDYLLSPRGNRVMRWFINFVVNLYMFALVAIMIAGGGSLLMQFGLPKWLGGITMAAFAYASVALGTDKFVSKMSIAVPVLVVAAVSVCAYISIMHPFEGLVAYKVPESRNALLDNWLVSAMLYIGYNMLSGIAILIPLGVKARDEKTIFKGSTLAGLLLSGMAFVCAYCLINNWSMVCDAPMPTLTLARNLNPVAGLAYAVAIYLALYTSAASYLFSIGIQLDQLEEKFPKLRIPRWITLLIITLAAYTGNYVGFTNLISWIYPIIGYLAVPAMAFLVYNYLTMARFR